MFLATPCKDFRPPTPIVEDPNEDPSVTPIPLLDQQSSGSSVDANISDNAPTEPESNPSSSATPKVSPTTGSLTTLPTAVDAKSSSDEPDAEDVSGSKTSLEGVKIVKKVTLVPPNEPVIRPVTPTTEKGKSKTTGKTITGWL